MKSPVPAALAVSTLSVVFGLGWYHAQYRDRSSPFLSQTSPAWYVFLAAALIVTVYASGLPDEPPDRLRAVLTCLAAPVAGSFGVLLVVTLIDPKALPRFVPAMAPFVLAPIYWIGWVLQQRFVRRQGDRERVVSVVSEAGDPLIPGDEELENPATPWPERPYTLVATMSPEVAGMGETLVSASDGSDATLLVLGPEAQAHAGVVEQATRLHEKGVRVRTVNRFTEEWLGKVTVEELGPMALMFDIADVHRGRYSRVKRGFDVVVAIVALPVVAVVGVVVVLVNAVANRGPLLFTQPRVGRDGALFTIVKFRSLLPGTDQRTPMLVDDARATSFGRVLRRFHLDELPQIWNVLMGDLSVVGPRPEQPHLVEQYRSMNAAYSLRHAVRPGLTGWAQVKYRYGEDGADAIEKLQYDLYYLKQQSFTLDLQILVRTVRHIVRRGGR
jgi:lipopolysaccharide/colanic/teichoic acid biosynthesis glycosyltransferase